jgi:diaminohydroxyphosphoribosylaminopyrimidine deaminase/5-amino-6-(5-phosphoribosylamino)uracil reductase
VDQQALDQWHMARALELAAAGRGAVEPNPLVGCVVVRGAEIIGEGWHRSFGGPHAEIEALAVAGPRAAGATLVVTLEPCCHQGKTPPCTEAILAAGIRRVVLAHRDPFPHVAGKGAARLREAGLEVVEGVLAEQAQRLNAPYLKRVATGLPWVIAKWAMTLDGKLATRTGHSRWISGPASRRLAHDLRGRVDAVVVGRGTVEADDPLLIARPPGPRTATRVVLASRGGLPAGCRLLATAGEAPLLVALGPEAPASESERLKQSGCEVFCCRAATHAERWQELLEELGRRGMTNILVEGGRTVLGTLFDQRAIDEVHVFVAPMLIGGAGAPSPIGGEGLADLSAAVALDQPQWRQVGTDLYVSGPVRRS